MYLMCILGCVHVHLRIHDVCVCVRACFVYECGACGARGVCMLCVYVVCVRCGMCACV